MKITRLVQTCSACPSQWEAQTIEGHGVYIRYRWGQLTIYVGNEPGQHGLDGKLVFSGAIGDEYDGFISWDDVAPIVEKIELN